MVEASFAEKLRRRQASLRQSNARPRGSEEALAAQQLARRQASEYAFQQRMLEQGLGVQRDLPPASGLARDDRRQFVSPVIASVPEIPAHRVAGSRARGASMLEAASVGAAAAARERELDRQRGVAELVRASRTSQLRAATPPRPSALPSLAALRDAVGEAAAALEANLFNLIHDVRAEFGVANLPVSIGLSGFGGWGQGVDRRLEVMRAQYNVSTYVANVATVETRGFFRDFTETGGCINQGYHWFGNGETYVYVGTAMGAAMKALLAGTWVQPKIDYLPPAGGAVSCASAFACGPYADGEPLCYW
jgi:hypothetical protein